MTTPGYLTPRDITIGLTFWVLFGMVILPDTGTLPTLMATGFFGLGTAFILPGRLR